MGKVKFFPVFADMVKWRQNVVGHNKTLVIVGTLSLLLLPISIRASDKINGTDEELFGTGESPVLKASKQRCSAGVSNGEHYTGWSDCWRTCEALLPQGRRWPEVVRDYGRGQGTIEALWGPAVQAFIDVRDREEEQNVKSKQTGEELGHLVEFLYQCHALVASSAHSDYSDNDSPHSRREEHVHTSLVNPQLKCRARGTDTQDYLKCVSFIKLYDTFTFGKKAKETVDIIRFDKHVSEKQDELMDRRLEGDTVGVEDGLNVQKESLEKQKDITAENTVISAAQMASLIGIINSMPTRKTLLGECGAAMQGKQEQFKNLFATGRTAAAAKATKKDGEGNDIPDETASWRVSDLPDEGKGICPSLDGFNLILNTEAREMAKALSVQSGIEAAANLAKQSILKNRIKGIDGAIKKIDEFEPESLSEEELDEMYMRECALRPELPKCKIRNRQKVDGIKNSYAFGSNPKAVEIGGPSDDDGPAAVGDSNGDRGNQPMGTGIDLPDIGNLGGNGFESTPPPPSSYAGKGEGNPGGGGGGAPGNVSPPGNGAGTGGGQGDRRPASSAGPVKYDGSGGGWSGYNSGGKNRGAGQTEKTSSNPFSNLFGKKKDPSGSELMEFRNPASKSKSARGNIFRRLSRRYGEAVKGKKLLKYTIKKD